MKISNMRKNKKEKLGFTLVELIIVIGSLAALGSFAIPNFLNTIKLNKIEEAKAIMNGYASDCLGKFRISTDPTDFIENATPDELDNIKLNTLGYEIDGDKNKCSKLGIKPSDENDKERYAFDFSIRSDGKVTKTGSPSDNFRFLNSCRSWAGKNCGLTQAQKDEMARKEEVDRRRSSCTSEFDNWLAQNKTGTQVTWDENSETCTKPGYACEGSRKYSQEAVDSCLEEKYGKMCKIWRTEQKQRNHISSSEGQTKKECGDSTYWYIEGEEFFNKADFDDKMYELKGKTCSKSKDKAVKAKVKGPFQYKPTEGPKPCGEMVWLCGDKVYQTQESYKSSSCAKSTKTSDEVKKKIGDKNTKAARCKNFKPDPRCGTSIKKTSPVCRCR